MSDLKSWHNSLPDALTELRDDPITKAIAAIINDEIGGMICNERRAIFTAERIACFLRDAPPRSN